MQNESEEDYVEVGVTIVTTGFNLKSTKEEAKQKADTIAKIVSYYCENESEEQNCEEAMSVDENV